MWTERLALVSLLLAGVPALAQPPSINARLEALAAGTTLEAALTRAGASRDVVWLGWAVPAVAGQGDSCCYQGQGGSWRHRGCRLEGGKGGISVFTDERSRQAADLAVLVRYADGRPTELRPVGFDCPLDLGGRRFWWLGAVGAEESAAHLATWARDARSELDTSDALLTLSMQQAGVDHLIRLARDRALARDLRREAVFWLGQSEDGRAMEFLEATLLRPASRRRGR